MSIDLCAVRRIVEEEGIAEARRLGLVSDLLIGDGRLVFDFIVSHVKLHSKTPTLDTIKSDVGIEVAAIASPEPLSYYVKCLFDRHNRAIASDHTKQMVDELKLDDPTNVIQQARSLVADTMKWQFGRRSYADPRETVDDRVRKQMELEELHGTIDGYRTPWAELDVITRGMHAGEMWVLLAAKKTGKCVDRDTLIVDPETGRVRTIEDAYRFGGDVHTFDDGKIAAISPEWVDRGVKNCIKLTFNSGRHLTCTPEHPLLTSDGWIHAGKLGTGCRIAAVRKIPSPRRPKKMDLRELDALAFMLAEGCSSGHTPSFSNGDKKIVGHARRVFEGLGCRVEKSKSDDFGWYIYSGVPLGRYEKAPMRKLLEKYGVFGLKSADKFIPDSIFSLPNDQLARFIGIIWSCDGKIERSQGDISIGLASRRMVEQLSWLLTRFGIVGRIREKTNNGFKNWEYRVRSECYDAFKQHIQMIGSKEKTLANHPGTQRPTDDVVMATPEIIAAIDAAMTSIPDAKERLRRAFGGRVNLYLVTKKKRISRWRLRTIVDALGIESIRWLVSDDVFWDCVVSVEKVGKRKVYDASVDRTNCFVANFLVVHNSWGVILFFRELIKQGLKPLLVTMEMASTKIIRRFDAMYSELDFNDFRSGLLGIDGIDKYVAEMKRLSQEGEFWVAGDGLIRCPADVEILAHDLEPDVILIDGMYLMQPSTGRWGSKYDKVSTVADELQSMPHRLQLPMLYTSQFNRNLKDGSLIGDSGKVGFAYEIAQNADLALGMYVNDDLKLSNRRLWSVFENREGTDFTMLTRFDLDQMNFEFVREVQASELMPEKRGASADSFSF